MKYKTIEIDGKTYIVPDENGNPIVIDETKPEGDADREIGLDAIHLYSKIPSLQKEAKGYREEKEAAEKLLKSFEGIEDPAEAKKALEVIKKLEQKKLIDAGEIDKLKEDLLAVEKEKYDELKKELTGQIDEKDKTILAQQEEIFDAMVSSRFYNSDWFAGPEPKTTLIPEIAQSYFRDNFKVEKIDGKNRVVGYLNNGQIFSKEKPGELARFQEAIAEIISKHPKKETFLKPSKGSNSPGSRSRSNSEAERKRLMDMNPTERLKEIRKKNESSG